MELSSFSTNIIPVVFTRAQEPVTLSVNIDAFTPEFFREIGKRFEEKLNQVQAQAKKETRKGKTKPSVQAFEDEARALEASREIYADMLSSGVLVDWSVTENDVPIAPTKNVLMTLPPRLISDLWETCKDAASTVKKREGGEVEAISENSHSGTRAALALAPTG